MAYPRTALGAIWGWGEVELRCEYKWHMPTLPPCVTFRLVVAPLRGPWTVARSSLRTLRRVATFRWPLLPVLLLVSFPRPRSPVVGVLGLC